MNTQTHTPGPWSFTSKGDIIGAGATKQNEYVYDVILGGGKRTVNASNELNAVARATVCKPDRFEKTGPHEYTDVKSVHGHRCKYIVKFRGN